jgi:hypothetical protein
MLHGMVKAHAGLRCGEIHNSKGPTRLSPDTCVSITRFL